MDSIPVLVSFVFGAAKLIFALVVLYLLIGVRYIPHRRVGILEKTVVSARFARAGPHHRPRR